MTYTLLGSSFFHYKLHSWATVHCLHPLFYNLLHKELKININHSFAVLYFCTEWYKNLFFAPLYSSTFSIIIIKMVQTVPVDNRVLFSNAQLGPHIPEQLHTEH